MRMNNYNIMVIDDEYTDRAEQYQAFLEKEYDGIEIKFKIFSIELGRELRSKLSKYCQNIDAFFIDARLSDDQKGWGGAFGPSFDTILFQLEQLYKDSCVPPIFMLSKHWQDDGGLLANVNKAFSVFHSPLHASRYYNQSELEAVVQDAQTMDSDGKPNLRPLSEEREYIEKEILKTRSIKYNSSKPVDAVLQIAVPDEKKRVYQFLGLSEEDDKYLKAYSLSYQETTYQKMHIVVVSQVFMGMAEAARTTTAAILAFRPKLVMMAGICAGKEGETKLGDLIIANDVFDYSTGKLFQDALEHRPPHRPIDVSLASFVNNTLVNHSETIFAKINEKFHGDPPSGCKIHFASMGSGPWVVDTPQIFEDIRSHIVGNCIALDMEAYAVAMAAAQMNVPWIIAKSVQDYANGEKSKTETKFRAYAAFSSAYLLCEHIPKMMLYIG